MLRAVATGLLVATFCLGPTSRVSSGERSFSAAALTRGAPSIETAALGEPPHIVVLEDGSNAQQISREHERQFGVRTLFLYKHALDGYSAVIPPGMVASVEADPRVLFVDFDEDNLPAARAKPQTQPAQALSIGAARIDAELSSARSGDGKGSTKVNVAVVDGGIQPDHPDLKVVDGVNCVDGMGGSWADRDGHGTMAAGFIGALDNRIGRVGIAPGVRLFAVRALDETGIGSDSELICGMDWIAGTRVDRAAGNDIQIANMSFGGPAVDDGSCGVASHTAFHYAICGLVDTGVAVVASAGNDTIDVQGVGPAGFQEVLTVTAMADRDGLPGGLLPPPWGCDPLETSQDDGAADFSNYATLAADRSHLVAAPGVCIASTFIGSQYATWSGTSFAAPLVAGTVGLCIASGACAGLSPGEIIEKIVSDAEAYNLANPSYGFQGDPLRPISGRYYGHLINAGVY